jgi:hypothetical protein
MLASVLMYARLPAVDGSEKCFTLLGSRPCCVHPTPKEVGHRNRIVSADAIIRASCIGIALSSRLNFRNAALVKPPIAVTTLDVLICRAIRRADRGQPAPDTWMPGLYRGAKQCVTSVRDDSGRFRFDRSGNESAVHI